MRVDAFLGGDQVRLKEILARCPELDATAGHVNAFATMMCERTGERLPAWMDAVEADALPALHCLVTSLRRDQAAVTNGLTPALQLRAGRKAPSTASR